MASPAVPRDLVTTRTGEHYRRQLDRSWELLTAFAVERGLPIPATFEDSPKVANTVLCLFIQSEFERGRPVSLAKHAVLAVQTRYRSLRGCLRDSWDALQSWQFELENRTRNPIDVGVLQAMCAVAKLLGCQALKEGRAALAWEWFVFATLVAVGFYGMLRPGEIVALRKDIVRCPSPFEADREPWAIVAIERPKNRRALGRVQFAAIRDAATTGWLTWVVAECDPGRPLFPRGYRGFASRFAAVLVSLGLQRLQLTPASLRAGGCSWFSRAGVNPSVLKYWGRWASESSVAHYVQECLGTFVLRQLHPAELTALYQFVNLCSYLAVAPSCAWPLLRARLGPSARNGLHYPRGSLAGPGLGFPHLSRTADAAEDPDVHLAGSSRPSRRPIHYAAAPARRALALPAACQDPASQVASGFQTGAVASILELESDDEDFLDHFHPDPDPPPVGGIPRFGDRILLALGGIASP